MKQHYIYKNGRQRQGKEKVAGGAQKLRVGSAKIADIEELMS